MSYGYSSGRTYSLDSDAGRSGVTASTSANTSLCSRGSSSPPGGRRGRRGGRHGGRRGRRRGRRRVDDDHDSDDDGYDGRKLVVPYKEPLKDEVYTRPMFALRAIEGYAPQPVPLYRLYQIITTLSLGAFCVMFPLSVRKWPSLYPDILSGGDSILDRQLMVGGCYVLAVAWLMHVYNIWYFTIFHHGAFLETIVAQVTNTKQRKIFTKRHKRVKMVVTLVPVTIWVTVMIFAAVFPDPVHGTLYAAWGIQAFFPVFTLFGELYLVVWTHKFHYSIFMHRLMRQSFATTYSVIASHRSVVRLIRNSCSAWQLQITFGIVINLLASGYFFVFAIFTDAPNERFIATGWGLLFTLFTLTAVGYMASVTAKGRGVVEAVASQLELTKGEDGERYNFVLLSQYLQMSLPGAGWTLFGAEVSYSQLLRLGSFLAAAAVTVAARAVALPDFQL